MEEASKIMNDPATFCMNIPVRQINAFGCESIQDYINKMVLPFYEKQGIKLEVIDISSTDVYELALKKAIDHAKMIGIEAEVESKEVKSIRVFRKNFEDSRITENIEFVRVVKISGDEKKITNDNPDFKKRNLY